MNYEYSCDKSAISLSTHIYAVRCRPTPDDVGRQNVVLIEPSWTSTTVTLRQRTMSYSIWTASPKQRVQLQRRRPLSSVDGRQQTTSYDVVRCVNGPLGYHTRSNIKLTKPQCHRYIGNRNGSNMHAAYSVRTRGHVFWRIYKIA